jgi:hypothetical protein
VRWVGAAGPCDDAGPRAGLAKGGREGWFPFYLFISFPFLPFFNLLLSIFNLALAFKFKISMLHELYRGTST